MDIKVHKTDLPEDLNIGNRVAIDCEFMGLLSKRQIVFSANFIRKF